MPGATWMSFLQGRPCQGPWKCWLTFAFPAPAGDQQTIPVRSPSGQAPASSLGPQAPTEGGARGARGGGGGFSQPSAAGAGGRSARPRPMGLDSGFTEVPDSATFAPWSMSSRVVLGWNRGPKGRAGMEMLWDDWGDRRGKGCRRW